jgi:hypothetical protein
VNNTNNPNPSPIRGAPRWQQNTPQQPTVAIVQPTAAPTTGTTVAGTGSVPSFVSVAYGVGAPTFSAPTGTLYVRHDGTHGGTTLLYVNNSGANATGTTWVAIA